MKDSITLVILFTIVNVTILLGVLYLVGYIIKTINLRKNKIKEL